VKAKIYVGWNSINKKLVMAKQEKDFMFFPELTYAASALIPNVKLYFNWFIGI
jgi:hypothetical protein